MSLQVKILVLGASSLVGSHFVASKRGVGICAVDIVDPREKGILVDEYIPLDLSGEDEIRKLVKKTHCSAVVNFAARTDVDGCEKERPASMSAPAAKAGGRSAWRLNAELPGWLAEETARRGIPLVHLSTDFVFEGTKGPYGENAVPDPFGPLVSWYGYTKGVGESRVMAANRKGGSVIRLSYPYRSEFKGKLDIARNLIARHKEGKLYPLYRDQVITPTWIPDVTRTIDVIMKAQVSGVYHVASPVATTPFEFARALFDELGLNSSELRSSRLEGRVVEGVAPRPLVGGLGIRNVRALGIDPASYLAGIKELAEELRATAQKGAP